MRKNVHNVRNEKSKIDFKVYFKTTNDFRDKLNSRDITGKF